MPQPPFQVDGVQINPGAGLPTLTVTRDPVTDGMLFTDGTLASPVLLSQLVSTTISTVFIVSTTGPATYSSIQDALDAVPAIPTGEYTILVYGGEYTGNITWDKDRVTLFALGNVIHEVASGDNVEITGPVTAKITGVTFRNTDSGSAVKIVGTEPELVSSVTLDRCIFDIDVTATAVDATFVDSFTAYNCVASSGSFLLSQIQNSYVFGSRLPASGVSYDTALNVTNPNEGFYTFENCVFTSLLVSTQGSGAVDITASRTGNLDTNGDVLTTLVGGTTDALSADGPVVAVQNPVTALSGVATADVPFHASVVFTAQSVATYTLPAPRTNSDYTVFVEPNGQSPSIAKTNTGFTLTYANPFSGVVRFKVE